MNTLPTLMWMRRTLPRVALVLGVCLVASCGVPRLAVQLMPNEPRLTMDSGILTDRQHYDVPLSDGCITMAFRPDNRYLVATGDYESEYINVYDLQAGEIIKRIPLEQGRVKFATRYLFAPDGRLLIAGIGTPTPGTYSVFDARTFAPTGKVVVDTNLSWQGAFSPDGRYFIANGHFLLGLYDTRTWKLVTLIKLDANPPMLRFTPDGHYVAGVVDLSDYTDAVGWQFWSVPDLLLVKTINNVYEGWVTDYMDISPDGEFVAAAGSIYLGSDEGEPVYAGVIRIYRLDNFAEFISARKPVGEVIFSRHSKYLFVEGGAKGKIKIYRTRDFGLVGRVVIGKTFQATEIEMSPDRSRLALCTARDIWVWRVNEDAVRD